MKQKRNNSICYCHAVLHCFFAYLHWHPLTCLRLEPMTSLTDDEKSWIPSSLFRHKPMPWHDKHAFAYSRDHDDVSFRLQTHVKATGRKENSFHEDKDGEHDTKLRLCSREKNWSYEASTIARIFIEGKSLQDYEFINFWKWVKNETICNFNLMLLHFKLPSNY